MKRVLFFTFLAIVLANFAGCAGQIKGDLETRTNGTHYEGSNWNVFGPPPPTPQDLATAYAIKRGADAMASGQVSGSDMVVIGFVNNDHNESCYVFHPENPGMKITIPPNGGFRFFQVRNIPKEIVLYKGNGNISNHIRPDPVYLANPKIIAGVKVDLLFTVNQL